MTDTSLSPPPAATEPDDGFEARLFDSSDVTVGTCLFLTPVVALLGWLAGPTTGLVAALVLFLGAVRRVLFPKRGGLRLTRGALHRADDAPLALDGLTAVRHRRASSRYAEVRLERGAGDAPLMTLTERASQADASAVEVADLASTWLLLRSSHADARDDLGLPQSGSAAAGADGADPDGQEPAAGRRGPWRNLLVQALLLAAAVIAYVLVFDRSFGLAIVTALLVHELGHLVVMRAHGFPVHGIYFVPLLGAVAAMKQRAFARASRARLRIALAGPLVGGLVAVAIWAGQPAPHSWLWTFAAVSALLNLFNLLPAPPLDGSHVVDGILAALHERIPAIVAPALLIAGSLVPVVLIDQPAIRAFFLALAIVYIGSVRRSRVARLTASALDRFGVSAADRADARQWFGSRRHRPLLIDGPPPPDDPVLSEAAAVGYGVLTLALAGALGWIFWTTVLAHRLG